MVIPQNTSAAFLKKYTFTSGNNYDKTENAQRRLREKQYHEVQDNGSSVTAVLISRSSFLLIAITFFRFRAQLAWVQNWMLTDVRDLQLVVKTKNRLSCTSLFADLLLVYFLVRSSRAREKIENRRGLNKGKR